MPFVLPLFFFSWFLLTLCDSVNPVSIPIIKNNVLQVHTRRFARIPSTSSNPSTIVCIVPRGPFLYVCTLRQIFRVSRNGTVKPWFDVSSAFWQNTRRNLNTKTFQHGGVRSIAFHPNFQANRKFYLSAMETRPDNPADFNYISDHKDPIEADSVLVEFQCMPTSDAPIIDSYRLLFRVGMKEFDHPIKQILFFGRLLYIAHGDGSVQSAIAGGGQGNNALGKILRVNPLQRGDLPYTIPAGNPFKNSPRYPSEVFAAGFRNPHHLAFFKDGTLLAADSGRDNIEEVNIVRAGRNYGWSEREGTFVHKKVPEGQNSGLIKGIRPLPANDAQFGYEYPVIQVGHEGDFGDGFVGQAIAGGWPVQNKSPMKGFYYYSDFPESGNLYYSSLREMKRAVTRGPPQTLTQARTRQAVIWFDHDNNPKTPPKRYENLGDAMRSEGQFKSEDRVDVRFGRGNQGELYWSSKVSGTIYLFTSSLPGGPIGPPMG